MRAVGSHQAFRDDRGLMATLREHFAINLVQLLERRRMTQRALAEAVGVSEQTVSKWMNLRVFPEDKQIDKIVAVLSVEYEDLVKAPGKGTMASVPTRDIDAVLRDLARLRGYDIVKKS